MLKLCHFVFADIAQGGRAESPFNLILKEEKSRELSAAMEISRLLPLFLPARKTFRLKRHLSPTTFTFFWKNISILFFYNKTWKRVFFSPFHLPGLFIFWVFFQNLVTNCKIFLQLKVFLDGLSFFVPVRDFRYPVTFSFLNFVTFNSQLFVYKSPENNSQLSWHFVPLTFSSFESCNIFFFKVHRWILSQWKHV